MVAGDGVDGGGIVKNKKEYRKYKNGIIKKVFFKIFCNINKMYYKISPFKKSDVHLGFRREGR